MGCRRCIYQSKGEPSELRGEEKAVVDVQWETALVDEWVEVQVASSMARPTIFSRSSSCDRNDDLEMRSVQALSCMAFARPGPVLGSWSKGLEQCAYCCNNADQSRYREAPFSMESVGCIILHMASIQLHNYPAYADFSRGRFRWV